jgi:hypothetical protein
MCGTTVDTVHVRRGEKLHFAYGSVLALLTVHIKSSAYLAVKVGTVGVA